MPSYIGWKGAHLNATSSLSLCGIRLLAFGILTNPLLAGGFFLDFDGPRLLTGAPGTKVRGSFTCLLGDLDYRAVEGWAIGVIVEGARITSISVNGTAAEHALDFGFERTELTSGVGNEGA